MLDDPCPHCGHRRKPTMMSINHRYDDLSLPDMWNGKGEWWQAALLKAAVLAMVCLFLVFVVHF